MPKKKYPHTVYLNSDENRIFEQRRGERSDSAYFVHAMNVEASQSPNDRRILEYARSLFWLLLADSQSSRLESAAPEQ